MNFREIFNIISLRLNLSPSEWYLFEAHFTYTPTQPFDIIKFETTQIQFVNGRFTIKSQMIIPEVEMILSDLAKYYEAQNRLIKLKSQYIDDARKKEDEITQKRLRENLFSGHNIVKPFRELKLEDYIQFPIIDSNSFK